MEQKLLDTIEAREDAIISLLADLVQIDTTNPYSGDVDPAGEKAGQEYLAPILEEMGGQIDMFDCPDDIYERTDVIGPENRDFSDRPNLVATWEFGDGPTLIVNAHMDTVGVDTFEGDPFRAEITDGKMYGRGTSDCKSGMTCGVMAIKSLLEVADNLHGTLIFESVVDEECNGSGAGTLACIDRGYTGDAALFMDGDDQTITIGCSGCLTAALNVQGEAGHAARGTGVNAIEKGVVVQQALYEFKNAREKQRPEARLNLGIFHGGTHPAVVPARSRLELNMVYQLDEAEASQAATDVWGGAVVRKNFEKQIREAEKTDEWLRDHPTEIVWVKDLVPFDEPEDQQLVEDVKDSFVSVTGSEPDIARMVAWTDAAWPSSYGHIPTVLFGPADNSQPHTDNEHVPIENLPTCTKALALYLLRAMS